MLVKRRKRKRPGHKYIAFAIFTVVAIFIIFAIWTDKAVRPVAALQAEHFSVATTDRAIEKSASEYLSQNSCRYSDFASIKYDSSGRVTAIEAIPDNINRVQSELSLMINNRLEKSGDYAKIPVGSLTGSYMLAGKGFDIRLRICPARKASVSLKSDFTSAGNNQTCHRISAVVTAEIKSSLPLYDFETGTEAEFLLAENVIVGDVPEASVYSWKEY